jgi:hypothetical protein
VVSVETPTYPVELVGLVVEVATQTDLVVQELRIRDLLEAQVKPTEQHSLTVELAVELDRQAQLLLLLFQVRGAMA